MQDFSAEFTLSESKGLEKTPRFTGRRRVSTIPEGDICRGLAVQPMPANREPWRDSSLGAKGVAQNVSWVETEYAVILRMIAALPNLRVGGARSIPVPSNATRKSPSPTKAEATLKAGYLAYSGNL